VIARHPADWFDKDKLSEFGLLEDAGAEFIEPQKRKATAVYEAAIAPLGTESDPSEEEETLADKIARICERARARRAAITTRTEIPGASEDPIAALVAESFRLVEEECSAAGDEQARALDSQIAGMLAATAAGIAAQVTLLATYGGLRVREITSNDNDDVMARLFASIKAGLQALQMKGGGSMTGLFNQQR
jgi:hypothetical protein